MATRSVIPFLVAMMLVTGVCNTLLTKYQDLQCVRNCHSERPNERRHFEQPVLQTLQMFIGEMGCWLVVAGYALHDRYLARPPPQDSGYQAVLQTNGDTTDADERAEVDPANDGRPTSEDTLDGAGTTKPLVALGRDDDLRLPLQGTTLMNVGLLFVAASIYQMTRGALVLFVGLFSVIFLRRTLRTYQWLALVIVVVGVGIVGLAGAIQKDPQAIAPSAAEMKAALATAARAVHTTARTPEALRAIIGVLLIALAQIFTATQFVLEEWIIERYALEPLKMVGWEGVFGFAATAVGMIVLHVLVGRTERGQYGYFDAREGWREFTKHRAILVSSILIMISIGGFNFFGLSVTRTVSATSRSTIDTCRTLFIWIVSLALGWETFKWLQVVGFVLLVYGTFLFNDIVSPPLKRWGGRRSEVLLPEEPIEHM